MEDGCYSREKFLRQNIFLFSVKYFEPNKTSFRRGGTSTASAYFLPNYLLGRYKMSLFNYVSGDENNVFNGVALKAISNRTGPLGEIVFTTDSKTGSNDSFWANYLR